MSNLLISETKQSPLIKFSAETGICEMRGTSFLDNAHEFYMPIINWVKNYAKNPAAKTIVLFDFTYINTSSQRMVFDLLKLLNELHKANHAVHIDWLYDENDDDLKEVGDDLLSFMDFSYKVIEKVS